MICANEQGNLPVFGYAACPMNETIDAVDAPKEVLRRHAIVVGTEPHDDVERVNEEPQVPLFAIGENHQYLCDDGGDGGESIEVRLRVVGVTA